MAEPMLHDQLVLVQLARGSHEPVGVYAEGHIDPYVFWCAVISRGQIFDQLVQLNGWAPKTEVCERAGIDATRSTARNAYTKLRNLGLIEPNNGDHLQLAPHVMEAL